ncbi:MAG: acyl-CoA thioesterase [Actinomycetota bacterium]|nr:acyl-CoA thioesterase [Actinomycetota bacterium]
MPPEVTIRRRIQWFDTDSSTKYHNTAPLRLMEEAEAALLDELGIVHEVYGFMPRVHVSLDYRSPLRFWNEVEITVRVAELGRSSITYTFEIRSGERTAADGRVVAAFIDGDGRARPWPEEYRRLLDPASTT